MAKRPDDITQNPEQSTEKSGRGWPRWSIWLILILIGAFIVYPAFNSSDDSTAIPYDQFLSKVTAEEITQININNQSGKIEAESSDGTMYTTTGPLELSPSDRLILDESSASVEFKTPQPGFFQTWLPLLLPVGLIILFFWWINRRAQGQMSGMMSIGRSRAKSYSSEQPGTKFEDVAGYEGVKQEIREVVDFLKKPEKFSEIGARVPKGILLVGPPGTGKTLLARAVAGEAGVPFLSVTGSDFMEMFVGVGASRVRDLFETARKMGRAIIFIDELDSIGRKRGAGLGGGHDEREQTLNQLLVEMDGFENNDGVIMIAATNRPDVLDPALLRPGRFDRHVVVPTPDIKGRENILKTHSKNIELDKEVSLNTVARGTPGFTGADLANLVNEAALWAARQDKETVGNEDFEHARDKVMMGAERRSLLISDKEKETTAYHEVGHALVAASIEEVDPVHKVSIIPRGRALGVTMLLPEEDRHSHNKRALLGQIAMTMGGRAAEQLVFNRYTTGASDDLKRATELARKMVCQWGMSEKLGPLTYVEDAGHVFLGRDLQQHKEFSNESMRMIDEEVLKILSSSYERAKKILKKEIIFRLKAGKNLMRIIMRLTFVNIF